MFKELKGLALERLDVDEMVALWAFGSTMIKAYVDHAMENPEWLEVNMAELEKEIRARSRDNLERALKETNAQLDALRTAQEKREDLKLRQERLKAKLGKQ